MSTEQLDIDNMTPTQTLEIHELGETKRCVVYNTDIRIIHCQAWGLNFQHHCVLCNSATGRFKTRHVISYDYVESRLYDNEIMICSLCEEKHFLKAPEFPPETPEDKITMCAEGYAVSILVGDQYNLIRNKFWNRVSFCAMLPGITRYTNLEKEYELYIPRRFIHYCADALKEVYVLAYVLKSGDSSKVAFLRRDAMMVTLTNDPEAMALLCMMAGPGHIPEVIQVFDTELLDMYRLITLVQKMIVSPPSDEFVNPESAMQVTRATPRRKKRAPLSQEEDEEPRPKRRNLREYGGEDSSQDN